MRVRKVDPAQLARLRSEAWVDPSRRPCVKGGVAYVPVKDGYPHDCTLPAPVQYRGRGFFMLGDVAVVHGQRPPSADDLARIIALRKPRGIVHVRAIRNPTRAPDAVLLYGEAGEVCHREGGYVFFLDPCRVMYSMGNLAEKRRIAGLVRSAPCRERVADMFAGIGYFTIPAAGAGADVHAIEINPVAFGYLVRTIAANGLGGRVTPVHGDCKACLSGTYDRIIMGHFDALAALPAALAHAEPGATLHLHSIGSVEAEIRSVAAGAGFSADVHVHRVKKYGPHAWHVVQDIVVA